MRCHWVTKVDALATAIDDHAPELLCFFPDSVPAPIREIAKIKQKAAATVPLVVVSKAAQETDIAEALLAGAQDLADRVDDAALQQALPEVVAIAQRAIDARPHD